MQHGIDTCRCRRRCGAYLELIAYNNNDSVSSNARVRHKRPPVARTFDHEATQCLIPETMHRAATLAQLP